MSVDIAFDPQSPALRTDPQSVYNKLRSRGPIFENGNRIWVAVGYQACSAMLSDSKRVIKSSELRLAHMGPGRFHDYCANTMAFMERPDHPRVRAAVAPSFMPAAIKQLTGKIETLCEELLRPLVAKPRFDFVKEFAGPFPLYVVCDMLGVPREHWELFRKGAHDIVLALEPMAKLEHIERANQSCTELANVLTRYINERPGRSDETLLNLLKAQYDDAKLSWDELINQIIFLLVAGHETTTTLLSHSMKRMIDHPEIAARLREDPALTSTAVSEVLRLHPPLQFVLRTTVEDMDVEGILVPKGATIFVLIGGANRDPDVFPDPDKLDLYRANAARNLAFAAGPHTCLGNNLARLEGRIALDKILKQLPTLRFVKPPTPNENFVFQGYLSMPLEQKALETA